MLIKVPAFPFHYWIIEVHSEASTSLSLILAGLILKLGIFGMIR
jgi:NADH:ubiquinone oxidoreductase subunit 4 (subunit M)